MLSVEPAKRVYFVGAGISVDEPSGVAGVPDLLELIFTKTQVRGGPTRDVYWRAATENRRCRTKSSCRKI
jgi:hypothetical protein